MNNSATSLVRLTEARRQGLTDARSDATRELCADRKWRELRWTPCCVPVHLYWPGQQLDNLSERGKWWMVNDAIRLRKERSRK